MEPTTGDCCVKCGRLLTLVEIPDDAMAEPIVLIDGEASCCCGDYDEQGHHVNATCVDCCVHLPNGIYDGKVAGGGYYIVSPR
jgi:hypothetical protein